MRITIDIALPDNPRILDGADLRALPCKFLALDIVSLHDFSELNDFLSMGISFVGRRVIP